MTSDIESMMSVIDTAINNYLDKTNDHQGVLRSLELFHSAAIDRYILHVSSEPKIYEIMSYYTGIIDYNRKKLDVLK